MDFYPGDRETQLLVNHREETSIPSGLSFGQKVRQADYGAHTIERCTLHQTVWRSERDNIIGVLVRLLSDCCILSEQRLLT